MSSRPAAPTLDAGVRRLLTVVVIGAFMSVLDMTVVNVAIRDLGQQLHGSLTSIQWVITSYMLALAAAVPVTGWAARRLGARNLYVASLAMFTAASALCGLAQSTGWLIAFRALQGFGGGAILPVAQMLVARKAGPALMARAMAVIGSVAVMAPVLGPIVGGAIVDHISWRWIFLINVPLGLVGLLLAVVRLPADEPETAGRLDWIGLITMGVGLTALTYSLTRIGEGAPAAALTATPLLAVSILLIAYFLHHAMHIKGTAPLLNVRLFAVPAFAWSAITVFALGAAVFGPYLLMPLFFQNVQGDSALGAGALFAAQGAGAAVAIRLGAVIGHRVTSGLLAVWGTVIALLFTLPLTAFERSTPSWLAVTVLIGRGFGIGLAVIPTMSSALAALPRTDLPDGTAQINVLQRVGGSLATALVAVLLSHELGVQARGGGTAAAAYQVTNWLVVGLCLVALLPAIVLARLQRRGAAPLSGPAPPVREAVAAAE